MNTAGQRRAQTAAMAQPVQRAADVVLDAPDLARTLPVLPEIAELLPWPGGIRRGATVASAGSTSLLFALVAEAMAHGSWAAVAGLPAIGADAAVEYGIDLARLALVPHPGPDWPTVVGVLLDGVDVVVVAPPAPPSDGMARQLMARARKRGAVLTAVGDWPGCDLRIDLVERRWLGLGQGRGRLRRQDVTLRAVGRGSAGRPRQVATSLPPPSCAERAPRDSGSIPGVSVERWLEILEEREKAGSPDDGWT